MKKYLTWVLWGAAGALFVRMGWFYLCRERVPFWVSEYERAGYAWQPPESTVTDEVWRSAP